MKRVVVTLTDEAYNAITEHKENEHSTEITAALLTGLVIEPEEWIKKESLKEKNMNKEKRKRLSEAEGLLSQARDIIEGVQEEEQEGYDNLPEGFQNGDRGEAMQEAIDQMEEALNAIDEAVDAVTQTCEV